ncbi:MAG: hypothetical protein K2P99_00045, partial [Burkholderiales bacterium]|nr:hypothetical protein [Burkholderiales bacterium]
MSQDTFSYNLSTYNNMSDDYDCVDVKYAYIADANNGNYSNGLIQFNSTSMYGADVSSPFDVAQGYIQIPFFWTATLANGAWTDNGGSLVPDNINAVCCKGYHHLIHQVWANFGACGINNSVVQYWNLYMNENFKRQTQEEVMKDGDIVNFYLDSTGSYMYNSAIGEFNNNTIG